MVSNDQQAAGSGAESGGRPDPAPEATAAKRTPRRWTRRLLLLAIVFLIGLAILVAGAPYLAGRSVVRNFALARVNATLRGDLQVTGLSTGWSGPTVIQGITVVDPDRETVLRIAEVRVPGGVWSLARDYLNFGTVTIDGADVRVRLDEANNISLIDAFASSAEKIDLLIEEAPSSTLPAPVGQLELRKAHLVVEWPDGRRVATDADAIVKIDSLNTLTAKLTAAVEALGAVQVDAEINDLFAGGQFNLEQATGLVEVHSDGDLQLAAVDRLLVDGLGLEGSGGLDLQAGLANGGLDITLASRVRQVRADAMGKDGAPLDADLAVKGQIAAEALDVILTLGGGLGELRIAARGNPSALAEGVDVGGLLAVLADGGKVDLPGFSVDADGRVDLAALDRVLPGVMPLREGQRLRGGMVRLEGIKLAGGAAPMARGRVAIEDVAADVDAKRVTLAPIALEFDATVDAAAGLLVRRAELTSPFAKLSGAGTQRDLDTVFSASLDRLRDELGQFIDLSGYGLKGEIDGRLQLTQPDAGAIEVDLTVNARRTMLGLGDPSAAAGSAASVGREGNDGLDFALTSRARMVRADTPGSTEVPLDVTLNLSGGLGDLRIAAQGDPAALAEGVDVSGLVASLSDGGTVNLPGFTVDADGRLDLAGVDRLLPGLIPQREGQRLRSGIVRLEGVKLEGGSAPVARGSIALEGVAADAGTKRITLSPATLEFDAVIDAASGLLVRRMAFKSPFATFSGAGSLSDLDAVFSASLDRLRDEVGQFVDLSAYAFKGDVEGRLKLARPDAQTINVDATVDARGTALNWGEQQVEVREAHVSHAGQILLVDGSVDRVTASRLAIDVADELSAVVKGAWSMEASSGSAEIALQRADVAAVTKRLSGFGVTLPHAYTGQVRGTLTASVAAGFERVQSIGHLVIEEPTSDGAPIETGTVQVQWRDADVTLTSLAATVAELQIEAVPLTVAVKQAAWALQDPLLADGEVNLSGQLAPVLRSVKQFVALDALPAMEGNLTAQFMLKVEDGRQNLAGGGNVQSLKVDMDGRQLAEPNLRFQCVAQMDHTEKWVDVSQLVVRTAPLEAELKGRLTDYTGALNADLSGRYKANWATVTEWLHAYMPDLKKDLRLAGKHEDTLRFKGSLMELDPTQMEGDTNVAVASAYVYGVDLESIAVPLRLADGQVVMPPTDLRSTQGTARVAGTLDLRESPPVLTLRESTQVLDKVALTPALSKSMLSRVNPVFMHLADVEGLVSLKVDGLEVPFGDTLKTGLNAKAQLALFDIAAEPGGLLGELLNLVGMPRSKRYLIRPQVLALQVNDGRIAYDDFTLAFRDGLTMKFFGSVGLDETLDLAVSVPVTEALLQRTGVQGSAAQYLNVLKGLRVDVPIVGTRTAPRLDLASVNLQEVLDRALRDAAAQTVQETVGGLLGDLLKGTQTGGSGQRKDEGDQKRK